MKTKSKIKSLENRLSVCKDDKKQKLIRINPQSPAGKESVTESWRRIYANFRWRFGSNKKKSRRDEKGEEEEEQEEERAKRYRLLDSHLLRWDRFGLNNVGAHDHGPGIGSTNVYRVSQKVDTEYLTYIHIYFTRKEFGIVKLNLLIMLVV